MYCVLPIGLLIAVILLLGVWLGKASKKKAQAVQAPATVVTDDVQQKLATLKSMLEQGLITGTDYEAKKADILAKM